MKSKSKYVWGLLFALVGLAAHGAMASATTPSGVSNPPAAALPAGNAAQQWNKIAEDTVVGSGAFQGEGFVYMAYVSMAMDRAVNPGKRQGQSPDAAITESAYRILLHYFPANAPEPDGAPRRRARRDPGRTGEAQRNRARPTRGRQGPARAGARRPTNADRLDLTLPGAGPRTRRLASHTVGIRRGADAVDGDHAAVRAPERAPVLAATAPVAAQPAVGRRIQRSQVARRGRQRNAHARPDHGRDLLDRERRPPIQRPRTHHRDEHEP